MTRSEIVARAESALGLTYTWGKESWVPNAGSGSGTDCSGLILKCWEVPRTMLYQEEDGRERLDLPSLHQLRVLQLPRTVVRAEPAAPCSQEGDILAYNNGAAGHVVIYAGGDAWNSPIVYEAPGTGQKLRRASRYFGSEYLPRRRSSLTRDDHDHPRQPHGQERRRQRPRTATGPAPPASPGYYGDDYQTQAGTTATAWARWTPRFATSGYYNVYMRWTSGTNRASAAKVTVNTAIGQYTVYVNQRSGGGTWYLLGRYYFTRGISPRESGASPSAPPEPTATWWPTR